jgi:hypothetical protein
LFGERQLPNTNDAKNVKKGYVFRLTTAWKAVV